MRAGLQNGAAARKLIVVGALLHGEPAQAEVADRLVVGQVLRPIRVGPPRCTRGNLHY